MKFYKAEIKEKDGKKVYGDLPHGFAIGYEDEGKGEVVFPLVDEVEIPDGIGVEKIEKSEYDSFINDIQIALMEKKRKELEDMVKKAEDRIEVMRSLEEKSMISLSAVTESFEYTAMLEERVDGLQEEINLLKGE